MPRARTLLVVVLLLSYGAVGARQPAVRGDLPLSVSIAAVGDAVGVHSPRASTLLLDLTRLLYDSDRVDEPRLRDLRIAAVRVLGTRSDKAESAVPLPLDRSIWRETILQKQIADRDLAAAIIAERRAALLYHGLSALDDETLGWLGPDRDTLLELREHAGTFAAFGRSLHVTAGRVVVPGGEAAEPLWESLVGAAVTKPSAFVQHLYKDGRAAYFYDAVAHLDPVRQRFALGLRLPESSRKDRFIALFETFQAASPDWRPDALPFWRPPLDPGLILSTFAVNDAGDATGPMGRRLWDRVFRGDQAIDVRFETIDPRDVAGDERALPSDAAALAGRVARAPFTIGRRRLDTILFAQRVFGAHKPEDPGVATALRGFVAFPALMLTLERMDITDPLTLAAAAERADALDDVSAEAARREALLQFQATLGILQRIERTRRLEPGAVNALTVSLLKVEPSSKRGYEGRLAQWIRGTLVPALPASAAASAPIEEAVLTAIAGAATPSATLPAVEWEGAKYRVDAGAADLVRLRRIRTSQGGATLDAALDDPQALGATLASLLYAASIGDPSAPGVTAANAALRHDLGISDTAGARSGTPWRIPTEDFSGRGGWRVRGSLLGLDAAVGRLALRRLDPTAMPQEPKLLPHQRITLAITAALLNPFEMTDATRDEIVATLGRGRARAAALTADNAEIARVASEAGLSEWRRNALAWTAANDRAALADQFSLVELFWLGAPRGAALRTLDRWGTASLPLTGCLCLEMPRSRPWEDFAGRQTTGVIATRGADVALRVAEALAALHLPATLAPGVLAFALQDVSDLTEPSYPDDWGAFARAARELSNDRITDYVAALTANGPLVPQEDRH